MSDIQLRAVMKTDVVGFTSRTARMTPEEMSTFLSDNAALSLTAFKRHGGTVIKGEGDAYWVLFPSVHGAVQAALELQDELISAQGGAHLDRIAVRIAIGAGDVLVQDGDVYGTTVNMVARLESVTPADAIYLTDAAYLALAPGTTSARLVEAFDFKGIERRVAVYEVVRSHRARTHADSVVVFTDMVGYTQFTLDHPVASVQRMVDAWERANTDAARLVGGRVGNLLGDSALLVFRSANDGLAFARLVVARWTAVCDADPALVSLTNVRISANVGTFHQIRNTVFGEPINTAARLLNRTLPRERMPARGGLLAATGGFVRALSDPSWFDDADHFVCDDIPGVRTVDVHRLILLPDDPRAPAVPAR